MNVNIPVEYLLDKKESKPTFFPICCPYSKAKICRNSLGAVKFYICPNLSSTIKFCI